MANFRVRRQLALAPLTLEDRLIIEDLRTDFDKIAKYGKISSAEIDLYYECSKQNPGFRLANQFIDDMKHVQQAQDERMAGQPFADPLNPINSCVPDAVRQGPQNTCAFDAALCGLAVARPEAIVEMIRQPVQTPQEIEVQFPSLHPAIYKVKQPTSEEVGLFSQDGKWGSWPTIIQKAYGEKIFEASLGQARMRMLGELNEERAGEDQLQTDAIQTLTGHKVETALLAEMPESDILDRLKIAQRNHRVICLNTANESPSGKTGDGYLGDHAFAVTGLTPDNEVIVRDPHATGPGRVDGTSTVSIQKLKNNFRVIFFESDDAAITKL